MPSATAKNGKIARQLSSPTPRTSITKECKCPLEKEHKDKRLFHTERLPMSVQDAYKLVFLKENFMADVLASRKATNYSASEWSENPELKVSQRTVNYNLPIPIGSKTSSVSDTQTLAAETRPGEVYVVNSEVKNEGIPLADSFVIVVHVCIAKSAPPENCEEFNDDVTEWCTYSCYAIITYRKTVWGVIKGQLERSVYSGMEGIHRDVAAALRDCAEGSSPVSEDNMRSSRVQALNARKKRKLKASGYDSNKKAREENQGSGWQPFFVNLIFLISALLLFTLNVTLLHKVQALEAVSKNLIIDKACPPVMSGRLTADKFGTPPNQGTDNMWSLIKSLLASQKALYSSELQEVGVHLQKASNALDQADSELHVVLNRLPNSLDSLEEAIQDHIRNEPLIQQINELLSRTGPQDHRTESAFDVEIRVA